MQYYCFPSSVVYFLSKFSIKFHYYVLLNDDVISSVNSVNNSINYILINFNNNNNNNNNNNDVIIFVLIIQKYKQPRDASSA